MTNGERTYRAYFGPRMAQLKPRWEELHGIIRSQWEGCTPPNQLTSAELGKLVEALEWRRGDSVLGDQGWLPRVREAWLALVRWEADHG